MLASRVEAVNRYRANTPPARDAPRAYLARALRAVERGRACLAAGLAERAAERACRGSLWALRAVLAQFGTAPRSRRNLIAQMEQVLVPRDLLPPELADWMRWCAEVLDAEEAEAERSLDEVERFLGRAAASAAWAGRLLGRHQQGSDIC